jgi:BirA family transcriptional regulator, biotin operon repressor / biotin---[acetyl-CoA-carboxylase] ligase
LPDTPSYRPLGLPFTELQTIDSTNNYALTQIHAGLAQHGQAIFAHEQTAARGQRGKKWTSSRQENIALSIIIKPVSLAVLQQFQLSAVIAVAVLDFFRKYAGNNVRIKWPNDLYWKDRKAGGILIENILRIQNGGNEWQWAVAGIGININQSQFSSDLSNAVSLKQITGKDFDPVVLAKELCATISNYYHELIGKGFENILSHYNSNLYKKDKKVKLKKGNRAFEAVIKGISPGGKLIVQHGIEEQFDFGEIEWVIKEVK